MNILGGDGAEAFYHYGGGASKTLVENILKEIVAIGQNSRGAKIKKNALGNDYFGFIRMTNAPAVIVECAFVDNAKDIQIIDTASEQKAMGIAIAKGILKTLGITTTKPVPTAVEIAKKGIQKKCGLENRTMDYLSAYKSANDLFLKLWKAMK